MSRLICLLFTVFSCGYSTTRLNDSFDGVARLFRGRLAVTIDETNNQTFSIDEQIAHNEPNVGAPRTPPIVRRGQSTYAGPFSEPSSEILSCDKIMSIFETPQGVLSELEWRKLQMHINADIVSYRFKPWVPVSSAMIEGWVSKGRKSHLWLADTERPPFEIVSEFVTKVIQSLGMESGSFSALVESGVNRLNDSQCPWIIVDEWKFYWNEIRLLSKKVPEDPKKDSESAWVWIPLKTIGRILEHRNFCFMERVARLTLENGVWNVPSNLAQKYHESIPKNYRASMSQEIFVMYTELIAAIGGFRDRLVQSVDAEIEPLSALSLDKQFWLVTGQEEETTNLMDSPFVETTTRLFFELQPISKHLLNNALDHWRQFHINEDFQDAYMVALSMHLQTIPCVEETLDDWSNYVDTDDSGGECFNEYDTMIDSKLYSSRDHLAGILENLMQALIDYRDFYLE